MTKTCTTTIETLKISVITVCFNSAATLGEALASVANQFGNEHQPQRLDRVRHVALRPNRRRVGGNLWVG
jgi:hypothetical protein